MSLCHDIKAEKKYNKKNSVSPLKYENQQNTSK
jgi:hypothetical protein